MLTNWQTDLLLDAEAQSSDSTTKIIDLPRDGHIAMVDLLLKATNGATSNTAYGVAGTAGKAMMDTVTKLEIIANGSKTILSVTSVEDLIAEAIRITSKIPARDLQEGASDVQSIHVPIYFGRFIDDKLMMIPNGAFQGGNFFDSLQLKITYDLGTIAATRFATGTFTISASVKKLVDGSDPAGKLIKTFQHKDDYTTVASGVKPINLTYGPALFMRSIQVYCYEAGIAEDVDITKMVVEYNSIGGGKVTPFEMPWDALQDHNAMTYGLAPLTFSGLVFLSDTDTIVTRVPDIKQFGINNMAVLGLAPEESRVESVAGDTLTTGHWKHSTEAAAGAANTTDADHHWHVVTDVIPRYAYIDFDESKTMNDLLDTGGMTALVLKLTNGAAGGTVRVNEEFIMRATDFRSS